MKRLLALLLLPLSGCAVVAVGAAAGAAWVWVNGEIKTELPAPLPEVRKAAVAVLEDLEMVDVRTVSDRLKGKVTAMMADGTRVEIRLKAPGDRVTTVRIRVGTVGDKVVSEQILRHLERRLGLEPAPEKGSATPA